LINGGNRIRNSRTKQVIFESIFYVVSAHWFSLAMTNQIRNSLVSFSQNVNPKHLWNQIIKENLSSNNSEINVRKEILKLQQE